MSFSLDGFVAVPLKPNLFNIEVVGVDVKADSYQEWKRLGYSLVDYLKAHNKSAYVVSTRHLEHLLIKEDSDSTVPFSEFRCKGRVYFITKVPPSEIESQLPGIIESEEFVFALNTWVCFLKNTNNEIAVIESQMKEILSSSKSVEDWDVTIELLVTASDGCELVWFNPEIPTKV